MNDHVHNYDFNLERSPQECEEDSSQNPWPSML
jgi:hypothetical protein